MQELLDIVADVATTAHGFGDALIVAVIAALCLPSPLLALLMRPVNKGAGKWFFVCGAVYEAAVQGLALLLLWDHGGRCLLAAVLAVVQYVLLRKHAEDRQRLGIALAAEAIFTMVLSIVWHTLLVIAVGMAMYG